MMLLQLDMRRDVQEIFKATPHEKQVMTLSAVAATSSPLTPPVDRLWQVMMFSATLSDEMRSVCKKFMQDPMEIYVDDSKLTLHGLQQHYVKLAENEKNRKLNELLDALEFNQVTSSPATPGSSAGVCLRAPFTLNTHPDPLIPARTIRWWYLSSRCNARSSLTSCFRSATSHR